jgi:hypothetical protein
MCLSGHGLTERDQSARRLGPGTAMHRVTKPTCPARRRGVVIAEYIVICTMIGLAVVVGMGVVGRYLVFELQDITLAINAIANP